MKKFAADNLLFLRSSYPEIYKLVRNQFHDKETYAREISKNGESNMKVSTDEMDFFMYSRYDPSLEAARWAESLGEDVLSADNLLLYGFGLGYHAYAFMNHHPQKRLYIYEPDMDILLAAIESVDLRPILDNKQIAMFAVGSNISVQTQFLIEVFKNMNGSFSFVATPPYRKIDREEVNQFTDQISKTIRTYQSDIGTIKSFGRQWIENSIRNMPRNMQTPSFAGLRNRCTGIPAVIVGAGPSLSIEIEKLRSIQDRVLIIAAGSSIQTLLLHGIEPHLVVSMDPGKANQRVFSKLDVANIPFLYIATIHHSIIQNIQSPYLMHAYFDIDYISNYLIDLTTEDCVFSSSGTVTGTAIQAAYHLGCKEMIFIGQDFSYPNDTFYADGVSHISQQSLQRSVSKAQLTVENVTGAYNRTDAIMLNLKQDTEELIGTLGDVTYYNASPVGAVIKHTSRITFDQVADRSPRVDDNPGWFKDLIKQHAYYYSSERKQKLKRKVKVGLKEVEGFRKLSETLQLHLASSEQLQPTSQTQLLAWFEQFEKDWSSLINSKVYNDLYSFVLIREQKYAERKWMEMKSEPALFAKLVLLRNLAIPLVEGILAITPILLSNFEILDRTLSDTTN